MTIKGYRTDIHLTIISDEPLPDYIELFEIALEMREGDYSGLWDIVQVKPLNKKELIEACEEQGTDAGFFLGEEYCDND